MTSSVFMMSSATVTNQQGESYIAHTRREPSTGRVLQQHGCRRVSGRDIMLVMRHVIYSMQFKGGAVPAGEGVMKTTTSATSCSIQSVIGPDGVEGTFHPAEGGLAWFESEVRLAGQHAFTESGTISFGEDNHELRFSTLGQGHMGPSADEKYSAGAVTWKVEGGEGQFEGASGHITSNFIVTEDGEVTDYQFGVIFLK